MASRRVSSLHNTHINTTTTTTTTTTATTTNNNTNNEAITHNNIKHDKMSSATLPNPQAKTPGSTTAQLQRVPHVIVLVFSATPPASTSARLSPHVIFRVFSAIPPALTSARFSAL